MRFHVPTYVAHLTLVDREPELMNQVFNPAFEAGRSEFVIPSHPWTSFVQSSSCICRGTRLRSVRTACYQEEFWHPVVLEKEGLDRRQIAELFWKRRQHWRENCLSLCTTLILWAARVRMPAMLAAAATAFILQSHHRSTEVNYHLGPVHCSKVRLEDRKLC